MRLMQHANTYPHKNHNTQQGTAVSITSQVDVNYTTCSVDTHSATGKQLMIKDYLKAAEAAVDFTKQTLVVLERCHRAHLASRHIDPQHLRRAELLLTQHRGLLEMEETILKNLKAISYDQ
jgi:hypothetical protein